MKENPISKYPAPTREPFSELVSYETVSSAGFNYWEPSMGFRVDGEVFTVHIGDGVLKPNINIIVGCKTINKGRTLLHEWRFGTFEGKPRGETNGKETNEFDEKIEKILKPENMVSGFSLERRMKSVFEKKKK